MTATPSRQPTWTSPQVASTGIAAALVMASVFGTGLHLLSHLTAQIEDLRDGLRAEIRHEIGDVRQEIRDVRQEIRDLRRETRAIHARIDALYRQPSTP